MVGDSTWDALGGFPPADAAEPRARKSGTAAAAALHTERPAAAMPDDPGLALQRELVPLVARMAARDEAALATLYDRTAGKVYAFALRLAAQSALAEEITVDVFHQAWREAARYDATRARVLTWLIMMCRSRALDRLRAAEPAMTHADPASLVDEPAGADAPPDLLDAFDRSSALHDALARLAPTHRQLVGLAFFRGLSHQEIAEHARMPLGTVKSHLRRALTELRTALGGPMQ
jgi:RNA polymerase sigma-70 factor (ECF subfamily)